MKKNRFLLYLMIIIAVTLCIPSVFYLISNKTVDGFNSYYTYTLQQWNNETIGLASGIIVIGLLLCMFIIYILTVKEENKIFKSKKEILIFIMIMSFFFMLILPYLSSDIYYYIGNSWLAAEYNENPYYTSVADLQAQGINDEILDNTGFWKHTTSIYGPIWNILSAILVTFSFGSVTIALFIFKIVAYIIHILNCYLIYKITKSNKCMLLYGLNPLILLEFLSNVHNDSYLILFILLALYFMIKKKNIILTIIFLALSISIKYSTVLLVPFILIYCFRNKKIPKRILYCIISGLSIIALVVLFYMPYYKDFTIFTNMLVQGEKYNQSIWLFLILNLKTSTFLTMKSLCIPVFVAIYIAIVFATLFKRKIQLKDIMRKYNFVMLLFIFGVLATFQKWYIIWLFPTLIWQKKNMKRFLIYLTITAILPSIKYFMVGQELYSDGMLYSTNMLIIAVELLLVDVLSRKFRRLIQHRKERKCQN